MKNKRVGGGRREDGPAPHPGAGKKVKTNLFQEAEESAATQQLSVSLTQRRSFIAQHKKIKQANPELLFVLFRDGNSETPDNMQARQRAKQTALGLS